MRQFKALVFCHIGMIIEHYMWDKPGSGMGLLPAPPLEMDVTTKFLFPLIAELERELNEIELDDSSSTCGLIKTRITLGNLNRAQLDGLLGELHRNFTRETNKEKFLKIDRDKASLYKPASILSELARMAFKESEVELILAATSYAVGLDTASVFHSMRSLEKPIHALAKKLRIKLSKEIELATWGETLRANIRETPVVPLINEQGEKEKGRHEWHFSWCSFLGGFGWRGTERRRAKRAAAQWSGSQSGRRLPAGLAS
jgi:hypothetical protein